MSELVITPPAAGSAQLVLSDGDETLDLLGDVSGRGIWLADEPKLPLPAREDTFAEGADSEGRRRVRTRPTNGTGAVPLTIGADDASQFWGYVDQLQEMVESAHRRRGTLTYTPPGGTQVTYDIESISVTGLPQKGVQLLSFVQDGITVDFECRPYGRLAPVEMDIGASASGPVPQVILEGPIDSFDVEDVDGHVYALGLLTLTDDSSQNRDYIEVGLEQEGYDPDNPTPLLIDSDNLTTSGLAGATASDSDAYDPAGATTNNVIQATLTTTAVTACSTGAQEHIGRKRISSRLKASATGTYVRLAWKVGDGPISRGPWRAIPAASNFYDVYLDTITIEEVPEGTHEWTGYVEAYAAAGGDTVKVDFVEVMPAEVWGRVRAPFRFGTPTAFSARTGFNTESGGLNGDTLDGGGTWATTGDGTDYSVAGGVATRTATSDSANTGQWATVDTNLTNVAVGVSSKVSDTTDDANQDLLRGVVARFTDANNHLRALLSYAGGKTYVRVQKRVGGTITNLLAATRADDGKPDEYRRVELIALASGMWQVRVDGALISQGYDSVLATGGALATGDVGLYDEHTAADANTRTYDDFVAWVPGFEHAMYSGEPAMLTHEQFLRGTWGKLPIDGKYLTIPPATRAGRVSRIVVKARRLDGPSQLPDQGLSDDVEATLTVTPRVLLV